MAPQLKMNPADYIKWGLCPNDYDIEVTIVVTQHATFSDNCINDVCN